jgi:stress response protein SCP2
MTILDNSYTMNLNNDVENLAIVLKRTDTQIRMGLALFDANDLHMKGRNSPVSHFQQKNLATDNGNITYESEDTREEITVNLKQIPDVKFMIVTVACRYSMFGEDQTRIQLLNSNTKTILHTYELNDSEWDPAGTGCVVCKIERVSDNDTSNWRVNTLGLVAKETISTDSNPKYALKQFCTKIVSDVQILNGSLAAEVKVLEAKHIASKHDHIRPYFKLFVDNKCVYASEVTKKKSHHPRWSKFYQGNPAIKPDRIHYLRIEIWSQEVSSDHKLLGSVTTTINLTKSKSVKESNEWHELFNCQSGGKIKVDFAFKYSDLTERRNGWKWSAVNTNK